MLLYATCVILCRFFFHAWNGLKLYGYKLPKTRSTEELKSGTGYVFMTSKNGWQLSKKSITDNSSFLGNTLRPLYEEGMKHKLFYLAYNDDPPRGPAVTLQAHAKGVVALTPTGGFWLVHSTPNFPFLPNDLKINEEEEEIKSYQFPESASKNGQSFLCISLPSSEMEKIGGVLQLMRVKVYAHQIPETLRSKYPLLVDAAEGKYKKHEPWTQIEKLKTVQGTKFISFSKAKQFNKDLYSDWLTSELNTSLAVETWMNGPHPLKSNCEGPLTTLNIREINLSSGKQHFDFLNTQDHSKWAVSGNGEKPWICVGDINRMLSQYKRGGGTVCTLNLGVWKAYHDSVKSVDSCPVQTLTNNLISSEENKVEINPKGLKPQTHAPADITSKQSSNKKDDGKKTKSQNQAVETSKTQTTKSNTSKPRTPKNGKTTKSSKKSLKTPKQTPSLSKAPKRVTSTSKTTKSSKKSLKTPKQTPSLSKAPKRVTSTSKTTKSKCGTKMQSGKKKHKSDYDYDYDYDYDVDDDDDNDDDYDYDENEDNDDEDE